MRETAKEHPREVDTVLARDECECQSLSQVLLLCAGLSLRFTTTGLTG
jgi:hypothetical protein